MERSYVSKPTLNVSVNLNCALIKEFKGNVVNKNVYLYDLCI